MSKHKAKEEEPNFQIRPPFSKKFKPGAVKVSLAIAIINDNPNGIFRALGMHRSNLIVLAIIKSIVGNNPRLPQ